MALRHLTVRERLFLRLREEPDGCWVWLGAKNSHGYGLLAVNGRPVPTHRLAFELANGEIPGGKSVCHRCDTPACCRPSHLFLGTHAENMADRNAKGRARGGSNAGEKHGRAKLAAEHVLAIREAVSAGHSLSAVAERFGISFSHVSAIALRKVWRHI